MHIHIKSGKIHIKMIKVETSEEKELGIRLGMEHKEGSSYLECINFFKDSLFMHYFYN